MSRARRQYDFALSTKDKRGVTYTFRVLVRRSPALILADMLRSARRILGLQPMKSKAVRPGRWRQR